MNTQTVEKVIYEEGKANLQSSVFTDSNGIERVAYSGSSLNSGDELTIQEYLGLKKNPKLVCISFGEALRRIHKVEESIYLTAWEQISEEKWFEALECLPPMKWKTVDDVELFQMSEMTTGDITGHYARYGEKYFAASRRISVKYEEIAKEIKAVS